MIDFSDPQTYWLNVVNIVLGLVTLACIAIVSVTFFREVFARARQRVPAYSRPDDAHTFILPDLGVTMADGGEKLEEHGSQQLPHPQDEQNIFRSNN